MKILAISGSTREASTNTAMLKAIKALSPPGIEISVFHTLNTLPIFSPDNEAEKTPEAVNEFMHLIYEHNGVIISSPEYVRAIPGGLKNAIDWMVSRFEIIDKPIALIHASHRGDDMLQSLRLVLSTVSNSFLEELFFRISLIDVPANEIEELLRKPEYNTQITSFLLDFVSAIHQSQLQTKQENIQLDGNTH